MTPVRASGSVRTAILAAGGLGALGQLTQDVWPMAAAAVIVAALVVCYFAAGHAPEIRLEIDAPTLGQVGEPYAWTVTVANPSRRPSARAVLRHETCHGLLEPAVAYVGRLAPGAAVGLRMTSPAVRRGRVDHLHVHVDLPGPFGLFRREIALRPPGTVEVAPAIRRARALPLGIGAADGRHVSPGGEQVRGVREWRPGDSPRRVHWRSTARAGTLTVVEHADPRSEAVVLVAVGRTGEPGYENAIADAAATAGAALSAGVPVRLMWRPTGSQTPSLLDLHAGDVARAFARLPSSEPPDPRSLDMLTRAARQGAAIVLVAGPGHVFAERAACEAAAAGHGAGR